MRPRLTRGTLIAILVASTLAVVPAVAQDEPVEEFRLTWARTDAPVWLGLTERTWMWGLGPYSVPGNERYDDAPDGERLVQYFDKSRMEINDPHGDPSDPWYVTNGLLARELITGRMQVGDDTFEQHEPADVQIAGDPHPDSPTYTMLEPLLDHEAQHAFSILRDRLNPDGSVEHDDSLMGYDVHAEYHVPETDHTVASPFWEFMNSTGIIFQPETSYTEGSLFPNPFFATGFPITGAYWVNVPVGGERQDVLVQCFERRCLTYTPGNDPEWQVEAGNIGQHYFQWRYGGAPEETPEPFYPPGIDGPPEPGLPGCIDINNASAEELTEIIHIDELRAQQILQIRPFMYVDDLISVSGIGPARMDDIREQGLACV